MAKETFTRVDKEIWLSLWQWAKRRHPDKSPVWIKKKYIKPAGCRHWVFAAEDTELRSPKGKPYTVSLFRASDIPIQRHIKIRGEANPFDPKFETYFEDRLTSKMRDNLNGSKRLLRLWLNQGGKCPVCCHHI
jgi:RNA-directed DNA polymerase